MFCNRKNSKGDAGTRIQRNDATNKPIKMKNATNTDVHFFNDVLTSRRHLVFSIDPEISDTNYAFSIPAIYVLVTEQAVVAVLSAPGRGTCVKYALIVISLNQEHPRAKAIIYSGKSYM